MPSSKRLLAVHIPQRLILVFLMTAAVSFGPGSTIQAAEERLLIGREDNWEKLAYTENLIIRRGRGEYLDLFLSDSGYTVDEDTDLLMQFDFDTTDATGNYLVQQADSDAFLSYAPSQAIHGDAAGAFHGRTDGLQLDPTDSSFLGSGGIKQDFTIEFWAYSATMDEGESILLWRGAYKPPEGVPVFQEISCRVAESSLMWLFNNFFVDRDFQEIAIRLRGSTRIIPRTWHHHLIRFDATTGLIEFLLDGIPEAITYASESGREDGTIYTPYVGSAMPVRLSIGDGFTGFIDELRISAAFVQEPFITRYRATVGTAVTEPFDVGYANSRITDISVKYDTPPRTAVYFFYYVSEKYRAIPADDSRWVQFLPEQSFPQGVRGRYIQIMMKMMPDGGGLRAPSVSELTVVYEPDLPPLTPASLWAKPGDGQVTLSWEKVPEPDVRGYLVFYGTRPGYYFGDDADLGSSPVDAGDADTLTVGGLENGTAYYFSVVAYDSADPPHRSVYSTEVYARPSKIYGGRNESGGASSPENTGSVKKAVPVDGAGE